MDVGVDTQHHRHQGGGVRATWDLSLERDRKVKQTNSVVDPNTWNLDPDPGFWPNLDPGPDPDNTSTIHFERKNSK